MRTNYFNCEVVVLIVLSIIPWPGPTVFKISCPRDSASVVRKLIQKKWIPILEKYGAKMPVECPFHPKRDIFGPQQAAKHQHRPSQWSCGFCGKSFYEEKFLESHFDSIHKNQINMAEDAVCLADYCDILRCEVLVAQEWENSNLNVAAPVNTDMEIWRETTVYKTALTLSGPRELIKVLSKDAKMSHAKKPKFISSSSSYEKQCSKTLMENGKTNENLPERKNSTKAACENDLVDSTLPPSERKQQRLHEFQKLKANCKPELLFKLKEKCEALVQDCVSGLLVNLSMQEFKEVEEKLKKGVCWYLTCDRYWEDSLGEIKPFPWGLLFVLVMLLSLGICLVYYIIWVLFDSRERSFSSGDLSARTTPSHPVKPKFQCSYAEEYYPLTAEPATEDPKQTERYIYVTYPPELKRRLVERVSAAIVFSAATTEQPNCDFEAVQGKPHQGSLSRHLPPKAFTTSLVKRQRNRDSPRSLLDNPEAKALCEGETTIKRFAPINVFKEK